jgi:hypothetical protein
MSITDRFLQVGGTFVLPIEENNRYSRKVVTYPPYYPVLYPRMKSILIVVALRISKRAWCKSKSIKVFEIPVANIDSYHL